MLFEQKQDRKLDRTILSRREQVEREDERVSDELIRLALHQSATEAAQEEA